MSLNHSHHLSGCSVELLGELTILVGDPARVRLFAELLNAPEQIINNREFIGYSGLVNDTRISIVSTGIGVGSTEIAVIELIACGAKRFVRIGGCGVWQDGIEPGDIIMNQAMARSPGMLSSYVPDSYPAVACPSLLNQIYQYLVQQGQSVHTGIGLTAEGFYLSQGRDINLFGQQHADKVLAYWRKRKILNADMESAVIFILASLYGIPAANCLVAHVTRDNDIWMPELDYQRLHQQTAQSVIRSIISTIG
ncbi:MAG: nucleoside phosphorylase [Candidatus Schmidhempelia sp.]|nr:nucleoside phosphorylase [Candidatus Schmidhempelia sp.]